jgi:hypothetical protein
MQIGVPLSISNRKELGLRLGFKGRLCGELYCYAVVVVCEVLLLV